VETSRNTGSRLRFGQFEVDLSEGKLAYRGLPVRIENQPFQILAALLERPGEVIGREELRARLWPNGTHVDFDEGVNTAIRKLRYALHDSAETPVFVETIRSRGYRFLAPISDVTTVHDSPKNGSHPSSVPAPVPEPDAASLFVTDAASTSSGLKPNSSLSRRRLSTSLIALVLLVLAAGGWALYRWRTPANHGPKWEAMEIRKLPDTGNVDDVAISPDSRYVIYARRNGEMVSLRMRQLESGGDVEVLPAADVLFHGLGFSPDGNDLYYVRSDKNDIGYRYLYVMPALGGASQKLIDDIDSSVSFSPDGRQFLFMRGIPTKDQIQVRIANLDGTGGHLLATMEKSDTNYQLGGSWSPDGRTVAIAVLQKGKRFQSALYGISVADGGRRQIFSTAGSIGRPRWHPDGSSMLVPIYEPRAGRAQLWTVSYPSGKRERVTNDVSDYSMNLDMTPDGKNAVAAESIWASNIWALSTAGVSRLEQITHGESPMFEALETNSGKLLVRSPGEIWIMDANGTARVLFAKFDADHIRRCGTFVVALVLQEGGPHIMRLDGEGMHTVRLAAGDPISPSCSPDGKFVFYEDTSPPQRILRVPIEGGAPVEIAKIPGDGPAGNVETSNDGRFLAFTWDQYKPVPAMHISVVSSADGSLVKSFNGPSGVYDIRWSIDDHALQYVLTKHGVANLWEQRLSGGPPNQLTHFTSGLIFDFSWSKNGKRLLLARGSVTTEVVLLSHLR
jgi:DNA-binding winged helix-turn-helix (wHTH) protein/Tol biopolymer transport system component